MANVDCNFHCFRALLSLGKTHPGLEATRSSHLDHPRACGKFCAAWRRYAGGLLLGKVARRILAF